MKSKTEYEKGFSDAKKEIMKILKRDYINYCIKQNGMPYCKNCGISEEEVSEQLK